MFQCIALPLLLLGTAQAVEAPSDRLQAALAGHVAGRLGVAPEDVEVLHLGVGSLPECAGEATFLLDSAPSERFVGTADVDVRAYMGADDCFRMHLQPRLQVWREVPVAMVRTGPGETVRWNVGRVPLTRLVGEPMDPSRLEQGSWLARTTLVAGAPLTELVVRPAPDAPRGRDVTLLAGTADLLVAAPGRLVDDAFLGDRVPIANLASGAIVVGTLLAPGCAAVGSVSPRLQEACTHVQEP
jgi:hypothetical protein